MKLELTGTTIEDVKDIIAARKAAEKENIAGMREQLKAHRAELKTIQDHLRKTKKDFATVWAAQGKKPTKAGAAKLEKLRTLDDSYRNQLRQEVLCIDRLKANIANRTAIMQATDWTTIPVEVQGVRVDYKRLNELLRKLKGFRVALARAVEEGREVLYITYGNGKTRGVATFYPLLNPMHDNINLPKAVL